MALTDVELNEGSGGAKIAVDEIGGNAYEVVKQAFGDEGSMTLVSTSNPLPVLDTETQISLAALLDKMISAPSTEAKQDVANALLTTISAITQPLTDTQLRATPVTTLEVVPTSLLNGHTIVTTAGTAVVLASSTLCKSVTIKSLLANTGVIYVGVTGVSSSNGFELGAGDTISLDISNLNTIYINSSVSGEGVSYIGVN